MYLLHSCLLLYSLLLPSIAAFAPQLHDESFKPDRVLCVTRKVVSIGGIYKYTTLVNGTSPGPELRIPEEKTLWIRVYNDMNDGNLTMHWHGLAQAAAPFSDGTPLASQWPIPPHHYFDYELRPAKDSAGTYFYHSHVDFQGVTANGPLIVEDRRPAPYKVQGERTLLLSELFNKTDEEITQGLQATPFQWSGETGGILINGNTISNYDIVDPSSAKLSVIEVEPGHVYRFRYIAAAGLSYISLAFEDHDNLDVIEADGSYTKPYTTPLLQIGSGQRFSTLFKAKTCRELHKLGKLDFYLQTETRERPTIVTNYAILRYRNTCNMQGDHIHASTASYPKKAPIKLPPTIDGFLDYKLEPLLPNDFPAAHEVTRQVIIYAQSVLDKWYIWRDNNVSWTENTHNALPHHTTPGEPYLVALYKNQTKYLPNYKAAISNGGLDPVTDTYPAKIGEVIEVVIQQLGGIALDGSAGGSLDTHPWHAHGNHIYDIGGGSGGYNRDFAEKQLQGTHPVKRDTTMLFRYNATTKPNEPSGWRAWRLRVHAPGVWMIHCHTIQHMIMGMQTVWVFGEAADIMKVGYPAVSGYLEYGGDVNGNATHYPRVVHFHDLDK